MASYTNRVPGPRGCQANGDQALPRQRHVVLSCTEPSVPTPTPPCLMPRGQRPLLCLVLPGPSPSCPRGGEPPPSPHPLPLPSSLEALPRPEGGGTPRDIPGGRGGAGVRAPPVPLILPGPNAKMGQTFPVLCQPLSFPPPTRRGSHLGPSVALWGFNPASVFAFLVLVSHHCALGLGPLSLILTDLEGVRLPNCPARRPREGAPRPLRLPLFDSQGESCLQLLDQGLARSGEGKDVLLIF